MSLPYEGLKFSYFFKKHYNFTARCTLTFKMAAPMLSRVTWAFLKLLVKFYLHAPLYPVHRKKCVPSGHQICQTSTHSTHLTVMCEVQCWRQFHKLSSKAKTTPGLKSALQQMWDACHRFLQTSECIRFGW